MMSLYKAITPWLSDQLKKHGLAFVMLTAMVFYLDSQNKRMEERYFDCNEELKEVLKNNTEVLFELKSHLKK